jgi:hypothetical protein
MYFSFLLDKLGAKLQAYIGDVYLTFKSNSFTKLRPTIFIFVLYSPYFIVLVRNQLDNGHKEVNLA